MVAWKAADTDFAFRNHHTDRLVTRLSDSSSGEAPTWMVHRTTDSGPELAWRSFEKRESARPMSGEKPSSSETTWKLPDGIEDHLEAGVFSNGE